MMIQEIRQAEILVVDDDLGTRESLKMILKDRYNVFTVSNVDEAIKNLEKAKPDLIFIDIRMPKASGLDFLQQMKPASSEIPVVVITAFPSSQTAITAFRNGAFDYIIKPFDLSEILTVAERAVSHHAKLSERERLVHNLRRAVCENFFSTTEALLLAIEAKDSCTAAHSKRVSRLFAFVVRELGVNQSEIEVLRYGAFLHDIGKIGVSDTTLMKTGPLTAEEWDSMRCHPEMSCSILEPIKFLNRSLPMVRHHHEWYNGKGYPDGLKENEIPYEAAILSIIDCYDALTSDRPYRKKFSHQEALEIIRKEKGTQFVPNLAEKLIGLINEYHEIEKQVKKVQESSTKTYG